MELRTWMWVAVWAVLPMGTLLAGELGPLLGTFPLHEIGHPPAKPSAVSSRLLPPPEHRVKALALIAPGFDPASLHPLGWRLVTATSGFATLEGDVATWHLLRDV